MDRGTETFILLAGWIAAGTGIRLYEEHKEEINKRFLPEFREGLSKLSKQIQRQDILQEFSGKEKIGLSGRVFYAPALGIRDLLWNMTEELSCGMEVDSDRILICQETVELCELYDKDPYEEDTKGAFLIVSRNPAAWKKELEKDGIPCSVIGVLTSKKAKLLKRGDRVRFLDRAKEETRG